MPNNIKKLRKIKNLSMQELSEKTGIAKSTISTIESGKRRVNISHATKLAEFFGVSVDFILGRTIGSLMDEFMDNLIQLDDPYENTSEDERTNILAFIMRSIYDYDLDYLKDLQNYVSFLNAKRDFKD